MDSHTLQLLEFQSIRDELGEYCLSSEGKELIQQQGILTVPEDVHCLLSLVSEYRRILAGGSPFPALDFPPIRPLLRPLTKQGTVLEAEELAAVGRYILSSKRLKRFLFRNVEAPAAVGGATVAGGASALGEKAGEIPDLDGLSKEIFRTVDREGRLKESQIPELKAISRRLSGMRREVDRLVARYLSQPEYQSYWQNDRPTQRDGRMVLALKANFKGRIKGIVHELSSSGATVFIEPLDLVDRNNDIIHEQNAYRREAIRFLRALTAKAYQSRADLADMVEKVSFLDSLYARARYAVIHRCFPAVYRQGEIRLSEARHPLLGPGAVPIDVEIGDPTRMLIITGPNTGGKTVSLKTVGLLSLMNQFGMEIPAAEGSALGVHDNFFADIGDEQSIEQSLSTFSSHIVSLSRIVRESTSRSLVLLDELGAGTDPEEGVAIAMALLDHFIEKGSLTLATTHHGILKNYGYTRQGVQNASMEFDRTSLVPTFRMIIGIPGESHALEIAERVGMTNEITRNARSYLNDERNDISELIKRLSEKQRQLLETEKSHRERETELKEKQRNTDLLQLRLRQREM
ncbi:MAG TPA: endonuclease MutS2, partial [Spirochaetia bacterium]|nr:endonuclease MutS2 [Spirochaetia bacterium]